MAKPDKQHSFLVEENLAYVRSVALKLAERLTGDIEFDDLVAFGVQGLLEAARRFDRRQGTSFITFAYYRIRGAMLDGIEQMGLTLNPVEDQTDQRVQAFLKEQGRLANDRARKKKSRKPRLQEQLTDLSGLFEDVATILLTSWEAEELAAALQTEPDELERKRVVMQALSRLPDKERRLIELYYYEDRSLDEVGRELGLSKSWLSRVHGRAVTLLRDALDDRTFDESPVGRKKNSSKSKR